MTTNSEKVLNFMKDNYGREFSKQEIADALGISLSAVIGSINPLEKKGYSKVVREETVELEPATETRKAKTKVVKYHTLTEEGLAYDPVAEEAAKTAEVLGNRVVRLYDVGVAGIHRLLDKKSLDEIMQANVIIAIAGMEGALASVIGGLADCPVIAVPTSVGYGASFNGLAALLSMLNSCASGVSVVNIDNGFGAGYLASMINKK